MTYYEGNGVLVSDYEIRFGSKRLPLRSSNAGPRYLDGLHEIRVRSEGLFSSKSGIYLVYFDGRPDECVWTTTHAEAEKIVKTMREVLQV